MEEVIARRHMMKKKACWCLIILGIMSLAIGFFYLFARDSSLYSSRPHHSPEIFIILFVIEFIIGGCAIAWGTINLIKNKKVPAELIVSNGSQLTFADRTSCDIKDIVNVTCKVSKLETSGIGILQVVLKDREIKYKNVENATQTHKRLIEIMRQSREEENNG